MSTSWVKNDGSETLLEDGHWLIRRSVDLLDTWVSHTGCFELPRRVREGKCHACKTPAPSKMLGFLNMIEWEK